MKPFVLSVIMSFIILVSCYKPYNTTIDTEKKILVINGMITNQKASYRIHLSYVVPFDSTGAGQPAYASNVHVTDDNGKYYDFHDLGNGYYASDSLQFTGNPGSTYTLHINTIDGERYQSDPQLLNPGTYSDSVYAEFDTQETLSKITGMKILTHGADLLTDIKSGSDMLPHFRFTTNLLTQYLNIECPPFQLCNYYYCWQTDNTNPNVDLSGGDYSSNSVSINRHTLGFIDDNLNCYSLIYFKFFLVNSRVIYLDRYSLNNETWLYYKNIDALLRSDGKLFDPIATQINGNIKCLTHPENKVFGFFEASSVSHAAYKVDFKNLINDQPSISEIPYYLPDKPKGHWVNQPPFWTN